MNHRILIWLSILFLFFGLSEAGSAATYDYDLSIGPTDIRFSQDVLIAGQGVRIYATVHNVGNKDIVGYVSFFRGVDLIGNSQAISVLPGSSDDVFVDFTVPSDSFNIQAKIQGAEPNDQNSANNETQSALFYPDIDTDADGIVDRLDDNDDGDNLKDTEEIGTCTDPLKKDTDGDGAIDGVDEFPCNAQETVDTDHDGIGNNADVDDDNDGWSDSQEQSFGTDPLRKDTDGDGVNDPQDFYPLDSQKNKQEVQSRNIFQPSANQNANNNQNVNQALSSASQVDKNQTASSSAAIETLEGLTKELEKITESAEAAKKLEEQPLEKLNEAMEQVVGQTQSFFRLNNILMWLIMAIILVIGAIVFLFIKGRQHSTGFKLDSLKSPKEPSLVSKIQPAVKESLKTKLPPNVINLKEMMKKRKNDE